MKVSKRLFGRGYRSDNDHQATIAADYRSGFHNEEKQARQGMKRFVGLAPTTRKPKREERQISSQNYLRRDGCGSECTRPRVCMLDVGMCLIQALLETLNFAL